MTYRIEHGSPHQPQSAAVNGSPGQQAAPRRQCPTLRGGKAGGVEVKQNLARLFQVRGIPSLVAIDAKSGKFITGDARTGVMMAGNNKEKQNKLVESWKSKEAVPVEQASLSSGGQEVGKSSILTFLLRNPVYIIGIWYVVRKALGYFEDIGRVGEGGNEL